MFEDIYADSNKSNTKKRDKQLEALINNYIALRSSKTKVSEYDDEPERKRQKGTPIDDRESYGPEETYETWHKENAAPIEGDKLKEDTSYKAMDSYNIKSNWIKANFLIRTRGLEVLPIDKYEDAPVKKINAIRQHVENLKMLLHLNMLQSNWNLAYQSFCLLVRIPRVDIRTIWPIGVEILHQKSKETPNTMSILKDEKFFEWLSSFYPVRGHTSRASSRISREISAPVWRSGSKTHTPLYIISQLWDLLSKKNYSKLRSKLDELILEPPYNSDGTFYFLIALCNICECVELINSSKIDSTDNGMSQISPSIREEVLKVLKVVEGNLTTCGHLKFIYPKEQLNKEIKGIMLRLNNDNYFESDNDDDVSDDDDDDDDDEKEHGNEGDDSLFLGGQDIPQQDKPYDDIFNESEGNESDENDHIESDKADYESSSKYSKPLDMKNDIDFEFEFE